MKIYILCFLVFISIGIQDASAQFRRYMNHTEFGVLAYSLNMKESGFTAQTFNGYLLNPDFAIGGTTGYDRYLVSNYSNYSVIPVSLGARYTFGAPATTRFIAGLDAGYGFVWDSTPKEKLNPHLETKLNGGIRINPEVGLRFKMAENSTFLSVTLGYQYLNVKTENKFEMPMPYYDYNLNYDYYPVNRTDYTSSVKTDIHRLTIKVGFGF